MANFHLQVDDNDVKNGLLNVDSDGCLKPAKRIFFKEVLDDGTILCCGRPAKEMTQEEAYKLCTDLYSANALYVFGHDRVLALSDRTGAGIGVAYASLFFESGAFKPSASPIKIDMINVSDFKTEDV